MFLGAYPITPASDVLHELSKHKRFGVTTFQAEDEIAGVGAALGASFAGHLGVTTTSGPGVALKAETIGLAVMTELPLVICDIQRAGPSTGMPTKTEQADLLQVMYGRNGEAPVPVLAAQSPADCFDTAIEAIRIAVKYRTPVFLLSDGYIANGAEPWEVPDLSAIPPIDPRVRHRPQRHGQRRQGRLLPVPARSRRPSPGRGRSRARPVCSTGSAASRRRRTPARCPTTRPTTTRWSAPGRPRSTASSATSPTWSSTTRTPARARACWCWAGGRRTVRSPPPSAGSARPAAGSPRRTCATSTRSRPTSGEVLRRYDRVIVPEMNLGQLAMLLRAKYLVDVHSYSRVRGLPISLSELAADLEPRSTRSKEVTRVTGASTATNRRARPRTLRSPGTNGDPSTGSGPALRRLRARAWRAYRWRSSP